MAFANTSFTDVATAAIEHRNRKIADNVRKNNALLSRLEQKGNVKPVSGGTQILEEISFAQNANGGAYSGYDLLPVAASDVISAAAFSFKQYACPVVISGLEQLQVSGKEQMIDLMAARLDVAEATMANLVSQGIYGDGTGYGGKAITGLDAAVETTATASQTSTYGGISRTTWSFWRSYSEGSITLPTSTTAPTVFNRFWSKLVRGSDRPDLIIVDNNYWSAYMASLGDLAAWKRDACRRICSSRSRKLALAARSRSAVLNMAIDVTTPMSAPASTSASNSHMSRWLRSREAAIC